MNAEVFDTQHPEQPRCSTHSTHLQGGWRQLTYGHIPHSMKFVIFVGWYINYLKRDCPMYRTSFIELTLSSSVRYNSQPTKPEQTTTAVNEASLSVNIR